MKKTKTTKTTKTTKNTKYRNLLWPIESANYKYVRTFALENNQSIKTTINYILSQAKKKNIKWSSQRKTTTT